LAQHAKNHGLPRVNQGDTLLEGIALWGELKPLLAEDALVERALTCCDWAVAKGLLAIRSHVDPSHASLLPVGGIPHFERTMGDGAASVKLSLRMKAPTLPDTRSLAPQAWVSTRRGLRLMARVQADAGRGG
jgi:cytosine/adenosine deaminase-related metal-dependent hydrolase